MRGTTAGRRSFEAGGAAVEAVGLDRRHRHGANVVRALRGVSLTIGEGEFVAVTGPSGSGKSTLLHVLGGLDVPDAGQVMIGGQALGALSDDALTVFRRRRIGVVFQAYNLVPTLSATENVALPLLLDGVARRSAHTRADEVLEQVGLAARCRHRPDQLSGGEQQRVAIARALVTGPAVVLADEPTGSLDSHTAAGVLALLRRAVAETGRAVVMVTHDPTVAAQADRIVRLVDGRVDEGSAPRAASWSPAVRNGVASAPEKRA